MEIYKANEAKNHGPEAELVESCSAVLVKDMSRLPVHIRLSVLLSVVHDSLDNLTDEGFEYFMFNSIQALRTMRNQTISNRAVHPSALHD